MEEWEEWCAVIVTATVSTTAPINKKQKKVGMKYLAKILVRKLDLLHLCFSLNFYFLMFPRNFLLCFPC